MIPVMQTRFGGPSASPEDQGNCFMACLCSLLHVRLETAPDLHMDGDWLEVAQRFVAEHNYWMLFIPADWERIIHPSVHYLAT
ncbi:hypothetical protein LCGC14_2996950, partial [marine sediment metagenome]